MSEMDSGYGPPKALSDGPFKGWLTWGEGRDPYETLLGPFCFREEADGRIRAAFQPQPHHLNGGGALHGGCLMSFADFSLFAIAHHNLQGVFAVTLTFNSEFIASGDASAWVEAQGEVVRDTRSVVFVRGMLTQAGRPLLSFSGVLKKLRR